MAALVNHTILPYYVSSHYRNVIWYEVILQWAKNKLIVFVWVLKFCDWLKRPFLTMSIECNHNDSVIQNNLINVKIA